MYGIPASSDSILSSLTNAEPKHIPYYDILILDEVQDMTPSLYWVVSNYLTYAIRLYGKAPRIVVLGDGRQAIYEFRGADRRFCDYGTKIFAQYSPDPWKTLQLDQSFRLSHQNSRFINCMVGEQYISGSHDGPLPQYLIMNRFRVDSVLNHILPMIRDYGPERSAIIAPSVIQNFTLSHLTNALSQKYNIPVADPISEEGPLNPKTLNGKLTVGTYHQLKGSERDLVIALGVDESYFSYAGRGLPKDQCPNPIYVALTRAKHQLVVIQENDKRPVPFISHKILEDSSICNVVSLAPLQPKESNETETYCPEYLNVTRAIRHIDENVISDLAKAYLDIQEISEPLPSEEHLNPPDIIKTESKRNQYEAVSDINGIATVESFEWEATSTLTEPSRRHGRREDLKLMVPEDAKEKARWFAEEAAYRASDLSRYASRVHQMKHHDFDWLDDTLEETDARLMKEFRNPAGLVFEKKVDGEVTVLDENTGHALLKSTILGSIDIVEPAEELNEIPTLWEIKFTESLTPEHAIQLAIYGYLWALKDTQFPRLVLFNVRTGAKSEIVTDSDKVYLLLQGLLRAKYGYKRRVSDPEFLQKCSDIRDALGVLPKFDQI
jgi:hypothetical protein